MVHPNEVREAERVLQKMIHDAVQAGVRREDLVIVMLNLHSRVGRSIVTATGQEIPDKPTAMRSLTRQGAGLIVAFCLGKGLPIRGDLLTAKGPVLMSIDDRGVEIQGYRELN